MNRRDFLTYFPASLPLAGVLVAAGTRRSEAAPGKAPSTPIEVGSERQLFLDELFFAQTENIKLSLHRPVQRETVITCEKPWEKKHLHYSSVLKEGDRFRMWYRVDDGGEPNRRGGSRTQICYAESQDGVHWEKPNLGLTPWGGSRENNILFPNDVIPGSNGCCVIVDADAPKAERYKMVTTHKTAVLWGYVSADGLRWRRAADGPIFDRPLWGFDSHNILVRDNQRKRYVIYCRGWINENGSLISAADRKSRAFDFSKMSRVIRRSESTDFRHWSKPKIVVAADQHDPPGMDFYTNATIRYTRAARAWLMFPMVLIEDGRRYPGAPGPGTSDVQFLSSRDGIAWNRQFRRAYIRPGPEKLNWVDRNPIMGVGIVSTGAAEMSMYYSERYRSPQTGLRRATLRTDGFVSVEGPYRGWGEFTTHPLDFKGRKLEMNYSTAGGGAIRVELQNAAGNPLPGFSLDDCPTIFGDEIEGIVNWKSGRDLSDLAGQPVRLRVKLRDADLFAFRFRN